MRCEEDYLLSSESLRICAYHRMLMCFTIRACRLSADGEDFFTSYDEVYESFDAMGLQENLLRGIYAYGVCDF